MVLPRDHSDYTELENCQCILCHNYRVTLTPYLESAKLVEDHKFRCKCNLCKSHRQLNNANLAADNKRTLWSESVFVASHYPWGPLFLDWIEQQVLNPAYSPHFWTRDAELLSLDAWVELFVDQVGESNIRLSVAKIYREPKLVEKALGVNFTEALRQSDLC